MKGVKQFEGDQVLQKRYGMIHTHTHTHTLTHTHTHTPRSPRTIQRSELFYCHPHLLRQLGVHTILLDLMKTYLGISSRSSVEEALLTSRRKRRLYAQLDSSATPPVADCCRFLCNFARISQANQRALFCYLSMFLNHVDEYPGTPMPALCTCIHACK